MIWAWIRLTRPYYSLPLTCGLFVITSYITGGDLSVLGMKFVYGFIALYLVISAGYTLNDVCDISADAVNNPNRILPKKKITPKAALIGAVILFAAGIIVSTFCGIPYTELLTVVAGGLVLYDLFSKKMGIFKNITAAALTTSLYPLSFALAEPVLTPRLNSLYIFPAWLFFTAVGYEMLKDIEDIKGDSIRQTGLSYRDHPGFLLAARIIIVAASVLTLLPYLLGYCEMIYLFSSITAIFWAGVSLKLPPRKAVPLIYAEVFIITAGSLVDLWVYGP